MAITNVGFTGPVTATNFALMSQHQGSLTPVVCGRNDLAVAANPAATLTCTVAPGSAAGQGVMTTSSATESVTFTAVSTPGQTRWDAVVLRRNWASSGSASLVVVAGTAAASAAMVLPSGVDLVLDGTQDQVLALVQITYGSTVPTAVVDRRVWASKVFTAPSVTALPPASLSLYGMEAVVGSARYRCLTDVGGSAAWLRADAPTVATSGFISAGSGFTITSMSNQYALSADGYTAQYVINVRRTGVALQFNSYGALVDTTVCTVTGLRPSRLLPVQFRVRGGPSSTSIDRIVCWGYLLATGELKIESGIPNTWISQSTVTSDISVEAFVEFTRGA